MSLRDKMIVRCHGCDMELDNTDPIPPLVRHFVKCDCEWGWHPIFDGGEWKGIPCHECGGWGEFVFCTPCYHKYLYSDD